MLNFHHLRYFWFVANEGHLTRASKRLHISQSALSIQIKALEGQLNHSLFERRGKRLILTEAGRVVLDYADSIFKTGSELVSKLNAQGQSAQTIIRVGALATLSRNFQMQFLKPLFKRKEVEIIITSGSLSGLLQKLEAHQIDVVLANSVPGKDSSVPWISHLISEQPVSLVGSPKLLNRSRSLKDLLLNHRLVLPSYESNIRVGVDALSEQLGVRPKIAAEVDDMAMLRLIARENLGLAVVPRIVVKDELDSGVLVEIKKMPKLKETFYAITLKRQFPNSLITGLIANLAGFRSKNF